MLRILNFLFQMALLFFFVFALVATVGYLAGAAKADHVVAFPDPSVIKVPPAQYDPRVRGIPKASVTYIPHSRMYEVCSNNGRNPKIGPKVLACAMPKLKRIYLPIGMSIPLRNAVLRHERGHIYGWVHANTTGDVLALDLDEELFHPHPGD